MTTRTRHSAATSFGASSPTIGCSSAGSTPSSLPTAAPNGSTERRPRSPTAPPAPSAARTTGIVRASSPSPSMTTAGRRSSATCASSPIAADEAEMAIAVADGWQRQGVGRAMLGEAIRWARAHQVARLRASVRWGNAAVIALLRSCGCPLAYGASDGGGVDVLVELAPAHRHRGSLTKLRDPFSPQAAASRSASAAAHAAGADTRNRVASRQAIRARSSSARAGSRCHAGEDRCRG